MKSADHYSLLSFNLSHRVLAIDASLIQEVHLPVPVSPIPFAPDFMTGLININGQIIPQVDLAAFLNIKDDNKSTQSTLLLIKIEDTILALKVNAIIEPLDIKKDQLLDLSHHFNDIEADHFSGYFHHNDQIIACIHSQSLRNFIQTTESNTHKISNDFIDTITPTQPIVDTSIEFILVFIADRVIAFNVNIIKEIVDIEKLSPIPLAPDYLLGIAIAHKHPLAIINTHQLMGLDNAPETNNHTVILLDIDTFRLGLIVDQILGFYHVNQADIISNKGEDQQGFMRDGTFIETCSLDQLINKKVKSALQPYLPTIKESPHVITPYQNILTFRINDELFGINTHYIHRILGYRKLTPLIQEHPSLLGTIDFDGEVIPVMDIPKKIGFEGQSPSTELIIVTCNQQKWALATPLCDKIVQIQDTMIDQIEKIIAEDIEAFSLYNEELIHLLNIEALCNIPPIGIIENIHG